jgi:hypothetical protein
MAKHAMVCANCGGEQVLFAAKAKWNKISQSFEVEAIEDDAFCIPCGGRDQPGAVVEQRELSAEAAKGARPYVSLNVVELAAMADRGQDLAGLLDELKMRNSFKATKLRQGVERKLGMVAA